MANDGETPFSPLIFPTSRFSENDDPELANAAIEGLKALRDGLNQLTGDHQVVIFKCCIVNPCAFTLSLF